jgi:hypothetical protein
VIDERRDGIKQTKPQPKREQLHPPLMFFSFGAARSESKDWIADKALSALKIFAGGRIVVDAVKALSG